MSLATRALAAEHRRTLTESPDGLIHARDDLRVVHAAGLLATECGRRVMEADMEADMAVLLPHEGSPGPVRQALARTWDPVDCMACIARGGES